MASSMVQGGGKRRAVIPLNVSFLDALPCMGKPSSVNLGSEAIQLHATAQDDSAHR
jgi:hypothetical protein